MVGWRSPLRSKGSDDRTGRYLPSAAAGRCVLPLPIQSRPARTRALSTSVGVDHVLIDDGNIAAQMRDLVPDGVDGAVELVGVNVLRDTLRATRSGGTVCFTGMLSDNWTIDAFYPMDWLPNGEAHRLLRRGRRPSTGGAPGVPGDSRRRHRHRPGRNRLPARRHPPSAPRHRSRHRGRQRRRRPLTGVVRRRCLAFAPRRRCTPYVWRSVLWLSASLRRRCSNSCYASGMGVPTASRVIASGSGPPRMPVSSASIRVRSLAASSKLKTS
jgi:Zinc-binding dehydrogenase